MRRRRGGQIDDEAALDPDAPADDAAVDTLVADDAEPEAAEAAEDGAEVEAAEEVATDDAAAVADDEEVAEPAVLATPAEPEGEAEPEPEADRGRGFRRGRGKAPKETVGASAAVPENFKAPKLERSGPPLGELLVE
jgi:hypothetical protein